MAATHNSFRADEHTTTDVVPVIVQGEVVAEHVGSHDIVQLGQLNLSRALEELGVSLNQLHGLDVLGSGNVALIDSIHLQTGLISAPTSPKNNKATKSSKRRKTVHSFCIRPSQKSYILLENKVGVECNYTWS